MVAWKAMNHGGLLLAIDIGNTNAVIGVYDGERLHAFWRIATDERRMPDEYAVLLRDLLTLSHHTPDDIGAVVLASVVPPVLLTMQEVCERHWHIHPLVVSQDLDLGIAVRYDPPRSVGADRLANAVAVLEHYRCPALIVDFGTATTIDALDNRGAYVGGAIAPGLLVGLDALVQRTAQLPHIPVSAPAQAIGCNTVESMQAGILFGYAGLVDGLVTRMRAELGGEAFVVATGGLAEAVAPHTGTIDLVNRELTLEGMRLVYQRHAGRYIVSNRIGSAIRAAR